MASNKQRDRLDIDIKKPVAIIDADGILYAAALRGETVCDGKQMPLLSVEFVYADAINRIEQQAGWVDAETLFVCLTSRTNFRKDILPSYKENRADTQRPLMLTELKALLKERMPYPVVEVEGLEADDVCGLIQGKLQEQGVLKSVIISPDKDMRTIPGYLMQPGRDGRTPKLEYITEEQADYNHLLQTLMGDVTDGYKGCPRVGPIKAEAWLSRTEGKPLKERWEDIVELYRTKGLTEDDALVQARVSRILRSSDWNAETKEPILWTPL